MSCFHPRYLYNTKKVHYRTVLYNTVHTVLLPPVQYSSVTNKCIPLNQPGQFVPGTCATPTSICNMFVRPNHTYHNSHPPSGRCPKFNFQFQFCNPTASTAINHPQPCTRPARISLPSVRRYSVVEAQPSQPITFASCFTVAAALINYAISSASHTHRLSSTSPIPFWTPTIH